MGYALRNWVEADLTLLLLFALPLGCSASHPTESRGEQRDTGRARESDSPVDSAVDSRGDSDGSPADSGDSDGGTPLPTPTVGFATPAIVWAMPPAPIDHPHPWYRTLWSGSDNWSGANYSCADGSLPGVAEWYWSTFDITGDGLPDVVVTKDLCSDASVGLDHWEVYENTGEGFASGPLDWSLPTPSVAGSWPWIERSADSTTSTCADGQLEGSANWRYSIFDLTGDRLPDLVFTEDACGQPGVGSDHWLVYVNVGTGFDATPIEWSLPVWSNSGEPAWPSPSLLTCCQTCPDGTQPGSANLWYGNFDITGDARPDLVTTFDSCTADVGVTQWAVYENIGDGFSPVETVWTLPEAPIESADPWRNDWQQTGGTCINDGASSANWSFRTLDLTGDGLVELVTTQDSCTDSQIGVSHWNVHGNTGQGFSSTPTPFPLPPAAVTRAVPWADTSLRSFGESCADGRFVESSSWLYSLFDLTGDGAVDIVETESDCESTQIGRDRWRIYVNSGAGFDPVALDWGLPAAPAFERRYAYEGGWFETTQGFWTGTCMDGSDAGYAALYYSVFDLDGDLTPDLVVTQDSCDDADIGLDQWSTFKGGVLP